MRKSPLATSVKILLLTAGTVATAHAQSSFFYQAPTGPDGTWNLYEYVLTPTTFKNAHEASNGIPHPLAGATLGYLTDIRDESENTVVNQISYRADTWIGLTDRVGVAEGASEFFFAWTSGAPFDPGVFNRWNPGEPNNSTGEDAVHITPAGGWNDHKSGYAADQPVVDDISFNSLDETAAPNMRYLRKWATASPTPLPGIRSAAALSFPGTIASLAPASTDGKFGVREIRPLAFDGNIYDALNKAIAGAGFIFNGQMSKLDTVDPDDANANGGPILSGTPNPFLSNSPGADDNNIITIANGKVVVPSSGEWTIQVRSDDGFALRVVGQEFTSVNGAGQIDPLDPSTIYFYAGTGDANTRGVLTLEAGVYDIEFLHLEIGGGAYYEVTTAKGVHTTSSAVQWLAMGDGSVIPAPEPQTVFLTEDLIVRTATETASNPANTITEARSLIGSGQPLNVSVSGTTRVGDGQANPFPGGTPADNFAMQLQGRFRVDNGNATLNEPITLTFALLSDDGSQLRIFGQDFEDVIDYSADNADAQLIDVDGDQAITFDAPTGNALTFGLITLNEGEYDFEAFMFEEGGGANLSVLYSIGDKLATGLDDTFQPLSKVVLANEGWTVVPEPSTALLGVLGTSLLAMRRRRRP